MLRVTLLVATVLWSGTAFSATDPVRPNFVFLLIDDLGWSDVSCYGQTRWETPNIDRIAREGMKFTDAYAAGPVCSPTRASILAGKYPARLHVTCHLGGGGNYSVPAGAETLPAESGALHLGEVTVAEALKEAGYVTAMIGKWHVGEHASRQGFDETPCYSPGNGCRRFQGPERRFMTDVKGDAAVAWLEANRDKPFFLYFSAHAVHTKIAAKPEYVERYRNSGLKEKGPWNATYAGYVRHVDDNVGRILDKLDDLDVSRRTVVFFMSDNGGRGLNISLNEPLRGAKGQLYEGGIRVPMLIRWPGVTTPGSVCHVPVISTDFYPTMLEMAHLPSKPHQHMDGVSLVPVCRGESSLQRKALYFHYPHYSTVSVPSSAIRCGPWKLIQFYGPERRRWGPGAKKPGLPSGAGVRIEYRSDEVLELYNLANDLGEQKNLAKTMPNQARQLRARLQSHLANVGALLPRRSRAKSPAVD